MAQHVDPGKRCAETITGLHGCRLLDSCWVDIIDACKVQIRHQERGQVIVDIPNVLEQVCCIDVLHSQCLSQTSPCASTHTPNGISWGSNTLDSASQITACTSEGGSVTTRCTVWATIRHALWGKCPALRSLPLAPRTSCGERSTPQTADHTREVLDGIEQSYLGRKALGHGRKAQQLIRQRLINAAGGLLRKEIVERAAGEARQRAKALHRGTAAVKRRTSQS